MTFKEFRLSQGLSQPKMAKALGVGVSTVGGYETGRIKPSEKVIAKIKEVFDVDLNEAAPAAAPAPTTPAVEEKAEKPAKRTRKKKEATAEAAPIPAVVEVAPVVEEKVEKAAKRGRKKKEQPVVAPVDESLLQMQSDAEAAVHALFNEKGTVIIQSPMGGEITPEEVLAKVGPVDKVYIRVDQNAAYWIRGEESGAVNLW